MASENGNYKSTEHYPNSYEQPSRPPGILNGVPLNMFERTGGTSRWLLYLGVISKLQAQPDLKSVVRLMLQQVCLWVFVRARQACRANG